MISVAGVKLHRIWRPEISDETQLLIRSPLKLRNQLPQLTSQAHLPQISCCAAVNFQTFVVSRGFDGFSQFFFQSSPNFVFFLNIKRKNLGLGAL